MTTCPYCGFKTDTIAGEIDHMDSAHPEIVRQRLEDSGELPPQPASDWRKWQIGADKVATELYDAALSLAAQTGNEYNYCASCGGWGGNKFDKSDDHADDCELYKALVAYRVYYGLDKS